MLLEESTPKTLEDYNLQEKILKTLWLNIVWAKLSTIAHQIKNEVEIDGDLLPVYFNS